MAIGMNAIESAEEADVSERRDAAESFGGSMEAARQAMAAEPFMTVLLDLGVSFPPEDPSEPRPARAADLAYGLSCLQRRINKALVYGRSLQQAYNSFYSAHRSLLEERSVERYNFAAIDGIKRNIRDPFSPMNLTHLSVELREAMGAGDEAVGQATRARHGEQIAKRSPSVPTKATHRSLSMS